MQNDLVGADSYSNAFDELRFIVITLMVPRILRGHRGILLFTEEVLMGTKT